MDLDTLVKFSRSCQSDHIMDVCSCLRQCEDNSADYPVYDSDILVVNRSTAR